MAREQRPGISAGLQALLAGIAIGFVAGVFWREIWRALLG